MTSHEDRFEKRAKELKLYFVTHRRYPSRSPVPSSESRRLCLWVTEQRLSYRQGNLLSHRVLALKGIDPDFFTVSKGRRKTPLSWQIFVNKNGASEKAAIDNFTDHQGRAYIRSFHSIEEYIVTRLNIADICPSRCNPDSAVGSIERVLSFVVCPDQRDFCSGAPLRPSWTPGLDAPVCKSTYFSRESLYVGTKGMALMDKAVMYLPNQLIEKLRFETATENNKPAAIIEAIDQAGIFDNFHYGTEGRIYKSLVSINKCGHPQPRRISMSVTITRPRCIGANKIRDLYNYGAAGRPSADWRSRPMAPDIAELGEHLWKTLWHHLSPASQVCPPTGCQLLLYSSCLKAQIRPHKDNGIMRDSGKQSRIATDTSLNSHIIGTSVIVFSLFDEMEFCLLTPKGQKGYMASQKDHEWNEKSTVLLQHQSAFVLDPTDDENFMHAARYRGGTQPGKLRVAFVFRWLSQRSPFYVNKVGPLEHAFYIPDAAEQLGQQPQGHLWIDKLGL
jgi:hypothetical protein